MATYDSQVYEATVFEKGEKLEFKHLVFVEVLPDEDYLICAELFEINGVECSALEAEDIMGSVNFNLAMEIAHA